MEKSDFSDSRDHIKKLFDRQQRQGRLVHSHLQKKLRTLTDRLENLGIAMAHGGVTQWTITVYKRA